MASGTPEHKNDALELGEVEPRRDLFEKAMELGFEKMDLMAELDGLTQESGFSEENSEVQKLKVEIGLVDTQIDSIARQWAESKVLDIVNDPERRAKRVTARKEHFLKRVERKLRRNERKTDRFEKHDEGYERTLDRREGRRNRREARRDFRQEAREARRELRGRVGRQAAREIRRDGRQSLREDRRQDHLERKRDRIDDRRDQNTVAYDKGQNGDPGMPADSETPSDKYRGDQNVNSAVRDASFYGEEGVFDLASGRDYTDKDIVLALMDRGIAPEALSTIGPETYAAIDILYANEPEEAEHLKDALSQAEDSAEYQEALAQIQGEGHRLEDPYRILQRGEVARRQVEEAALSSTLGGKFSNLVKEFGRSPVALVALAGVAAGMFFFRDKIFTKKFGYGVGAVALGVAGITTTDFLWSKMDKEGRGLFDRLEWKPGDLMSGEVLDKYREDFFQTLPSKDRDSVDDMIKIFDVPMERVNDTFENALDGQVTSIETGNFIGQTTDGKDPLDSSTESTMDGKDMYRGLMWFYSSCADKAMAENPSLKPKDQEAKLRLGLDYARTHYAGLSFLGANYELDVKPRLKAQLEAGEAPRRGARLSGRPQVEYFDRQLQFPENPKLLSLAERSPALTGVLLQLHTGEVLVKGVPYDYQYTDQGKHVFTSTLSGEVYSIPENLQPGDLGRRVGALISASETEMKGKFDAFKMGADVQLSYQDNGVWKTVPGLPPLAHVGVDTGKDAISSFIFADANGVHISYDRALKDQYFSTLTDLQKAFDLQERFPSLVIRDVDHLLLGLEFKVKEVADNETAKTTTITIEYGHGHRGSLVYKNGSLESMLLDDDAELQKRWAMEARKETRALLSKSTLQDRIVSATGIDPDVYFRWNNMATSGIVSAEPHVEFTGGVFGAVGKSLSEMIYGVVDSNNWTGSTLDAQQKTATEARVDRELGLKVDDMHQGLVDLLYSKGFTKERFDVEQQKLLDRYEAEIITILEKAPEDLVLDASAIELKKDEAERAMAQALAPLENASWQTDQVQEGLYEDRLAYWISEVTRAIDALPSPVKESQVDAVIEQKRLLASQEASAHRGQTAETSRELLWDAQLVANKALWKPHAERVESYLSDRFVGKPGVVAELMEMYLAQIANGRATPAPLSGVGDPAGEYTTYFLSSVYAIMGAKEGDWWDRGVQFATEDYEAHKAQLQGIRSYADWARAPELRPTPPGLESSSELLRLTAKASFEDWFDQNMDLSTWTSLEGQWPNTFRDHAMARLDRIVMDESLDAMALDAQVKRFAQFVAVEYWLYKICIDGTYKGWTEPEELRDRIIGQNFGPIWADPHKDYKDYARYLDPMFGEHIKGEEYGLLTKMLANIQSKLWFPDIRH